MLCKARLKNLLCIQLLNIKVTQVLKITVHIENNIAGLQRYSIIMKYITFSPFYLRFSIHFYISYNLNYKFIFINVCTYFNITYFYLPKKIQNTQKHILFFFYLY